MIQALKHKIPDEQLIHNPTIQNNKKQTVALILAKQGIIPPTEWNHDCNIQDSNYYTVEMYLRDYQLPIPNNWITDKSKGINKPWFQQAMYGEKITNKNINPEEQNPDGWTIAMIQALNKKIPEDRFNHNPKLQNKYGQTVQNILEQNKKQVPEQWICQNSQQKQQTKQCKKEDKSQQIYQEDYNNPKRDNNGQTIAMKLAEQKVTISKQYNHKPEIYDNEGNTVAIYLTKNNIEIPEEWKYDKNYRLKNEQTTAMRLAEMGIIPTKDWYHYPELKDINNHTVCYYLWDNGIQVPEEWQDNQYKNPEMAKNKFTQALSQVCIFQKIPNKKYYHDPSLKLNGGFTIAMYLAAIQIIPPKQWQHDPKIQNDKGSTVAMIMAFNGKEVPQQWYHDPNLKNIYGYTVEYYLQQRNKIVPDEWKTTSTYSEIQQSIKMDQLFQNKSLESELQNTPLFKSYKNNQEEINENKDFVQILTTTDSDVTSQQQNTKDLLNNDNEISKINLNKQYEKQQNYIHHLNKYYEMCNINKNQIITPEFNNNQYNMTFAMYLANNGIVPPKQWEHDPELQNYDGFTVAMYLASEHIIPPSQWYHKPELRNNYGWTVAMFLALYKIISPQEWNHDPEIKNDKNHTVCYYLFNKYYSVPEQWQDKQYKNPRQDINGETDAMKQAKEGKIPDKKNYHNLCIKNKFNQTVGILLSYKGIVPPNYWMDNIDMKDNSGNSIKTNLLKYNYIYSNKCFIQNAQLVNEEKICNICQDNKKQFIKTRYGHNICLQCYKKLVKENKQTQCPICKKQDWIIPIDINQYNQFINFQMMKQ